MEEGTRAYHDPDPQRKKFGAEVVVGLRNGSEIVERLDNPNAHSLGARPFRRPDYESKLYTLTEGLVEEGEIERFVELVGELSNLDPEQVRALNVVVPEERLEDGRNERVGII